MPGWSNSSVFASSMSAPATSTSTADPAAAPSGASRSNRGDGNSARTVVARSKTARTEAGRMKCLVGRVESSRPDDGEVAGVGPRRLDPTYNSSGAAIHRQIGIVLGVVHDRRELVLARGSASPPIRPNLDGLIRKPDHQDFAERRILRALDTALISDRTDHRSCRRDSVWSAFRVNRGWVEPVGHVNLIQAVDEVNERPRHDRPP